MLAEREIDHDKVDKKSDTGQQTPDELHVNELGLVVKEVTSDTVHELLQSQGELPGPLHVNAKAKRASR